MCCLVIACRAGLIRSRLVRKSFFVFFVILFSTLALFEARIIGVIILSVILSGDGRPYEVHKHSVSAHY